MNKRILAIITFILIITFMTVMPVDVIAAEAESVHTAEAAAEIMSAGESTVLSAKAIAAAIVVGLVGAAGAIGMGMAISKSAESMARQPEMAGKINSTMMLGLVFIETAIIYALIIAILVIFVL